MSVPGDRADWNAVSHAYVTATDTPVHLAHLLGADQEARKGLRGN